MFNLGNEAWSGNKKQGDEIAFSLLGDYTSDSSEPIMLEEVSLNGEVMCSGMDTEESWSLMMLFIVLGLQQHMKYKKRNDSIYHSITAYYLRVIWW